MFWEVEERYWPEELEFKNFDIDNTPVEEWLQPVVRRNRYFWEIALQYMPWYEAPDGQRYKVVCLGFPISNKLLFKVRQVLVVDRNLDSAPLQVGRDAVRCLVYTTALVQCLNEKVLGMWVPENERLCNGFLTTLTRWRDALKDHPNPERRDKHLQALDRATKFFTFLKENNEQANFALKEGFRAASRLRRRLREQGYKAVVRHGEPDVIWDIHMGYAKIRWHYAHVLKKAHRSTGKDLLHVKHDRYFKARVTRQDYIQMGRCYRIIETVVHAFNHYHVSRTPREALIGDFDRLAEMEARAVALPR